MLIYCYFNKEIYINWCFVDVMKIHPTPVAIRWYYQTHKYSDIRIPDRWFNITILYIPFCAKDVFLKITVRTVFKIVTAETIRKTICHMECYI